MEALGSRALDLGGVEGALQIAGRFHLKVAWHPVVKKHEHTILQALVAKPLAADKGRRKIRTRTSSSLKLSRKASEDYRISLPSKGAMTVFRWGCPPRLTSQVGYLMHKSSPHQQYPCKSKMHTPGRESKTHQKHLTRRSACS